jgi:ankyrin repeat protein
MIYFYDSEEGEMEPRDYSNYYFAECCENGDLDGAQHALKMNPDIDISWNNNLPLSWACAEGQLDVVEWLLHEIPFVDIWCGDELSNRYGRHPLFVEACTMGNIDVAKYLLAYSKKKGITPDMWVISFCFDFACKRCYYKDIAVWLQTLNPEKYVIYWNEDGSINGYKIRTQKEINRERRWEQRKYLVWLASNQCPERLQKNILYRLPNDVSRYLIKYI